MHLRIRAATAVGALGLLMTATIAHADAGVVIYKHEKVDAFVVSTNWGMISDGSNENNDTESFVFFEHVQRPGFYGGEGSGFSNVPVGATSVVIDYDGGNSDGTQFTRCQMVFNNDGPHNLKMHLKGNCDQDTYQYTGRYRSEWK